MKKHFYFTYIYIYIYYFFDKIKNKVKYMTSKIRESKKVLLGSINQDDNYNPMVTSSDESQVNPVGNPVISTETIY